MQWRDDTTPRAYGHFDEAWVKPASSRAKIHAVVDSSGLPVRLALTTGEAHDNRLAAPLLSRLRSGSMLLADRGYDADWIRAFVQSRKAHGRMRAAAEKRCLVLARRSRSSNCWAIARNSVTNSSNAILAKIFLVSFASLRHSSARCLYSFDVGMAIFQRLRQLICSGGFC